jgi:formate dehydrogenase
MTVQTPAKGKRSRVRATPKGRAVDPKARGEVRALLGDAPRRRDLLIEHLHKIQDRYGCLSAAHLVALAAEMKMAMAEVYEVATFYTTSTWSRKATALRPRSPFVCAIQLPAIWPDRASS